MHMSLSFFKMRKKEKKRHNGQLVYFLSKIIVLILQIRMSPTITETKKDTMHAEALTE